MGRPAVLVVDGHKACSRCKLKLPVACFDRQNSAPSGYMSACKECRQGLVGNQTPGRRSARDSVLWTKYGIRESDFLSMAEDQDWRCAICNLQTDDLCVDHCHATKKVRGLLCRECNFGLGKFADDPNRLLAAAAYLMERE